MYWKRTLWKQSTWSCITRGKHLYSLTDKYNLFISSFVTSDLKILDNAYNSQKCDNADSATARSRPNDWWAYFPNWSLGFISSSINNFIQCPLWKPTLWPNQYVYQLHFPYKTSLYDDSSSTFTESVEINIAWDDAYQIRFDLGERGGKRIVDTNLTSYLYT